MKCDNRTARPFFVEAKEGKKSASSVPKVQIKAELARVGFPNLHQCRGSLQDSELRQETVGDTVQTLLTCGTKATSRHSTFPHTHVGARGRGPARPVEIECPDGAGQVAFTLRDAWRRKIHQSCPPCAGQSTSPLAVTNPRKDVDGRRNKPEHVTKCEFQAP